MAKYSNKIVDKICSLIRSDSYTISEICSIVNISRRTYYNWIDSKPNFKANIEKAEKDFQELLIVEAKRSLMRLVKGYSIQEKKIVTINSKKLDENGNPISQTKEVTTTEKHFQPNITALIFTLTNKDPENWKNKQSNEVSGIVSVKSDLERLTDEELKTIVQESL